jgi:hypothetical protein
VHKGWQRAQRIIQNHKAIPKSYPTIPFLNHTLYCREDPRLIVTTSSTIMIVVHFAKVSTLYPRVVILSLAKRLEKPPFCHSYTFYGVWPRDHYMLLQRFTIGRMPGLAEVVCGTIAMLRFPWVVAVPWHLLHHVGLNEWPCHFPLIRARHTSHNIPN